MRRWNDLAGNQTTLGRYTTRCWSQKDHRVEPWMLEICGGVGLRWNGWLDRTRPHKQ